MELYDLFLSEFKITQKQNTQAKKNLVIMH